MHRTDLFQQKMSKGYLYLFMLMPDDACCEDRLWLRNSAAINVCDAGARSRNGRPNIPENWPQPHKIPALTAQSLTIRHLQ